MHTSLADQAAAIEELATRIGVRVERWYRDAGASGATVAARPAFRQLLTDCMAAPRPRSSPGYVLILNDSRFGRFPDPDEAAALRFQLKQAGWRVRFAEGDDVQDELFRPVVRALGSAQASEYRRNLQRNTRRGMKGAANQGFWTRRAPIGYRRKVVYPPGAERVLDRHQLKAPDEKVKLTPHEEEATLIRWLFEAYVSGQHSLASLSAAAEERFPGKRWSRNVVQHILRNEVYTGDVRGGRRRDEPDPELYGCDNAHPAIVDRMLFERVQRRLEENRNQAGMQGTVYLMTGILTCPHCSEPYTGGGGGQSRTKNPAETHRRFYRDRGGVSGACAGRIGTVMRHLIDDAVVRTLGRTLRSAAMQRYVERALDGELAAAIDDSGGRIHSARKHIHELTRSRERLIAAIADGTVLPGEAQARLNAIRAELESLETQLQVVRFGQRKVGAASAEREEILRLARDFPSYADRFSPRVLREMIRLWLAGATFDKRSRMLEIRIRRLPALPSLALSGSGGLTEREEARPLIRRVDLRQGGAA
jgi:DNA invertase Pin-like site-specific DNA recombinase